MPAKRFDREERIKTGDAEHLVFGYVKGFCRFSNECAGDMPVFGLCLGWPTEEALEQAVKPRMPVELILHKDRYRDPDPDEIGAYDAAMSEYYRGRGANARVDDWSAATANGFFSFGSICRPHGRR